MDRAVAGILLCSLRQHFFSWCVHHGCFFLSKVSVSPPLNITTKLRARKLGSLWLVVVVVRQIPIGCYVCGFVILYHFNYWTFSLIRPNVMSHICCRPVGGWSWHKAKTYYGKIIIGHFSVPRPNVNSPICCRQVGGWGWYITKTKMIIEHFSVPRPHINSPTWLIKFCWGWGWHKIKLKCAKSSVGYLSIVRPNVIFQSWYKKENDY